MLKLCSKCGCEKSTAAFNKDCTKKDGLFSSCKVCSRATVNRSYRLHEEAHQILKRKWKAKNIVRNLEINRQWRQDNPEMVRSSAARYRERLRRATPKGVDLNAIKRFREACPAGHHVDHYYPLSGKNVCGLNVVGNLQYLLASMHWHKGIKMPEVAGGHANL